jgi:type IV secretory pathway VirB4 component
LTPSYRNQLAFLDIYGDRMGNTNYNMAVTGTSGAGKTGLVQPILRSVLDSGGIAWVFDMGDGYKSFCENVGGTYLDGKSLKFNPFANISNINESGNVSVTSWLYWPVPMVRWTKSITVCCCAGSGGMGSAQGKSPN